MDGLKLKGVIEAVLFTAGKTVRKQELLSLVEGVSEEEVDRAVAELRQGYDNAGCSFCLEEVAHGYRLTTRPEFGSWLNKFYKEKEKRHLSAAAMESLAIIAYKQPAMRLEIETIRGVNSEGVLHSLLEAGLIRIMGRKQIPGRPILYGTTNKFLELFGLKNLADLPPLEELEKMLKEKEKKIEADEAEEEIVKGGEEVGEIKEDKVGDR